MSKPLTVRLHPTKYSRLYVEVTVYPTLDAMKKAGRKLGVRGKYMKGWAHSHRRVYPTCEPRVSQVGLAKNFCGVGIVSHEMTHAALHYFSQKNGGRGAEFDGAAEPLAYAIGDLTSGFYRWAYRTGVVEK